MTKHPTLFIFSDFAWTESKTQELLVNDYYNSFGFGTNISMPNGLLTLIYGLGRKIDNTFLLRTGKIHLGFLQVILIHLNKNNYGYTYFVFNIIKSTFAKNLKYYGKSS